MPGPTVNVRPEIIEGVTVLFVAASLARAETETGTKFESDLIKLRETFLLVPP